MELWIRSQDKTFLKKVGYCLEIIEQDNNCCKIKELGYELGFYQSKERALEILDEIQSLIDNTIHIPLDNIKNVAEQIYTPPFLLYEMPKE